MTRRDLKLTVAAAIVSALASFGVTSGLALAQTQAEKDKFTVGQVLDITSGLGQLSSYDTTDKEGKASKGYYKFSADLRMLVALNIDLGRRVQQQFQSAMNDVTMQLSNGTGVIPDDKKGLQAVEINKLLDAQSRVGFYRLKKEDLKLEENPIPVSTLSLILPIVDR